MPTEKAEKRLCRKCHAPIARWDESIDVMVLKAALAEAKLSMDRVDAYYLLQMSVRGLIAKFEGECAECAEVYTADGVMPKTRCNTCLQVDGVARVRLVSGTPRKRFATRG